MFRVSKSALINAPPERVFAWLADVRQHVAWYQSFNMRVTETSPGEPRVGYVGCMEGNYRDRPVSFRMEITRLEPYSHIAFLQSEVYLAPAYSGRTRSKGVRPVQMASESAYRISYDLEPSGLGTRLTRSSEPAGQWWALPAYLVWPLVQPIRYLNQSQVLKMIKSQLEGLDR